MGITSLPEQSNTKVKTYRVVKDEVFWATPTSLGQLN